MSAKEGVGCQEWKVGGGGQDADQGGWVSLISSRSIDPPGLQTSSVVGQLLWAGSIGTPVVAEKRAPGEGQTTD